MAQMFGLEYETLSERRAARNQRWESLKAQVADNPNALAAISFQQSLQNALPQPGDREAEETQTRLAKLMKENRQMDGEDDFDYAGRMAKQIRDTVADVNPQLAVAANDQLLKTAKAKQEMAKLKTQNEAERLALDEDIYDARMRKTPVVFGYKNGRKLPVRRLPVGATQEEIDAALQEMQSEYGKVYDGFDVGNGNDLYVLDKENSRSGGEGDGPSVGNATQRMKLVSQVTNAESVLLQQASLMKDLAKAPRAMQEVLAPTIGAGQAWWEAAKGTYDVWKNWALDQGYTEESAKRQYDRDDEAARSYIDSEIDKLNYGNYANIVKSKVYAMAYALARQFDPSGRLSDKDVEMALGVLTGRGDPDEILKLIEDRNEIDAAGLQYNLDEITNNEGGQFTAASQAQVGRYLAARQAAKAAADEFRRAIQPEVEQIRRYQEEAAQGEGGDAEARLAAKRARARRLLGGG